MIKFSLASLAKYLVSSEFSKRKLIQKMKFPNSDEPFAMKLYYKEARRCIKAFVKERHTREWLIQRSHEIEASRPSQSSDRTTQRLRRNAESVLFADKYFSGKNLEVLDCPRMTLVLADVHINVTPDLCVRDGLKTKIYKLQFGGKELPEQSIKVITQCMLEGARQHGFEVHPSGVIYLDLPRGTEYPATKVATRLLRDVKAACETISQVWEKIPCPPPSRRKAVA
jgi:hypothetical protein